MELGLGQTAPKHIDHGSRVCSELQTFQQLADGAIIGASSPRPESLPFGLLTIAVWVRPQSTSNATGGLGNDQFSKDREGAQ